MIISIGTRVKVLGPLFEKMGSGTLIEIESFNSEGMDFFRVYNCKIKLDTGEVIKGTNLWMVLEKKNNLAS